MKLKIKIILKVLKLYNIFIFFKIRFEYSVSKLLFLSKYNSNKKDLIALQNIHRGERCFIIGNGPSLDVNDLDRLKDEVTFATNHIYKIFNQTEWRPTYYTVMDDSFVNQRENIEIIRNISSKKTFLRLQSYIKTKELNDNNIYFLNTKYSRKYLKNPKFSTDISKEVYTIATVSYVALQLAIYMGFKEIYLIGFDHSYSNEVTKSGVKVSNPNIKSYFGAKKDDYKNEGFVAIHEMDIAYNKAYNESLIQNVLIYNATKGGKLEVFPRIDFEELFK